MPRESYLDYNATAPLRPEARRAMVSALDLVGNPSSVHRPGRAARAAIEEAREAVAALVGAKPVEVIFTSGASEANATVLRGCGASALFVSAGEHVSVLADPSVTPVALLPDGRLDLSALETALEGGSRPLVSLMAANNETGVIQPLEAAAALVRAHGGWLHCDAVQAAGRLAPDLWRDADYLSLSAHKLGGPKGVGALVLRGNAPLAPLLRGGGQEWRLRAGTENVAAIAGFGAVAQSLLGLSREERAGPAGLRDAFERDLKILAPGVTIHGADAPRLAGVSCFSLPNRRAETLLIALDLAGVYVSSGSACSSGKVERSHVLTAMGVAPAEAAAAIRVSLGWASRAEDLSRCLDALAGLLSRPGLVVA
ncbi:MAG: cysteine desulfurase [Rhodospirillales bacterium]|nr:cysteine desulfurase [Rhodospirillales bacterium]